MRDRYGITGRPRMQPPSGAESSRSTARRRGQFIHRSRRSSDGGPPTNLRTVRPPPAPTGLSAERSRLVCPAFQLVEVAPQDRDDPRRRQELRAHCAMEGEPVQHSMDPFGRTAAAPRFSPRLRRAGWRRTRSVCVGSSGCEGGSQRARSSGTSGARARSSTSAIKDGRDRPPARRRGRSLWVRSGQSRNLNESTTGAARSITSSKYIASVALITIVTVSPAGRSST